MLTSLGVAQTDRLPDRRSPADCQRQVSPADRQRQISPAAVLADDDAPPPSSLFKLATQVSRSSADMGQYFINFLFRKRYLGHKLEQTN